MISSILGTTVAQAAVPPAEEWSLEGDFSLSGRVITATNGLTVKHQGVTLTAQQATVDEASGQVVATGNVQVVQDGKQWSGEELTYNFKTGEMSGEGFRTGAPPVFAAGQAVAGDRNAGIYVGGTAYLTTDDYAQPGYRVQAKTLLIVPGEYIEVQGATVYLGRVPVFYFPRYRHSLKHQPNNWEFVPGYRTQYGAFLLTRYNWILNDRLDGTFHLDGRTKRGVGLGPDFNWHLPRVGEGLFRSYYTYDLDPSENSQGEVVGHNRGRVDFGHRLPLSSNWLARALVRYQSDETVLHDFFEAEYRANSQPSTYGELARFLPNLTVNLYAQPRINPFFETVERLPDLKITALRQQIGASPLYYESVSSGGYYQREFAYDSPGSFAAFRADTFHQVVLPHSFFGWLNVTPRVGGRFTYYSEAHGPGATTTEHARTVFNTGVEFSTKASRVWSAPKSTFWEIDALRHIVIPSINYAYVPTPNVQPFELPQFDYLVPTTRLLPVTFPDFNDIDAIDSQNVIRFGLRNKLQTKRQGQIENVVNWALFMDWHLDPQSGETTFSDIYSDLDYQPFHWLTLTSQTRYNLDTKEWDEANHTITLTPGTRWSLGFSHRYLRNIPGQGPSSGYNLIAPVVFARVNENWGLRMSQLYDAEAGVLQEQLYTLYRDFRSWTGALSFRIQENEGGPKDYSVAITFSLKAYPRFKQGDDRLLPSLLLGG